MAAYGEDLGNQIFVSLRRGSDWPPRVCDVRVRYEHTIGDIRREVAKKLGVPPDKQLLFLHKKELTPKFDNKTLKELNMHTGFSLMGYDMTVEPKFWPPVKETADGRVIDC